MQLLGQRSDCRGPGLFDQIEDVEVESRQKHVVGAQALDHTPYCRGGRRFDVSPWTACVGHRVGLFQLGVGGVDHRRIRG